MTTPSYGVDISKYQGAVNWATLKAKLGDGAFAFVRVLDDDGLLVDPTYVANRAGAKAAGVRVGLTIPYYQTLPAGQQLIAFLDNTHLDFGELPVAIDLESGSAVWTLAQNRALQWTLWVLEQVTKRVPVIYTSPDYWNTHILPSPSGNPVPSSTNNTWAAHYGLWLAYWNYNPASAPSIPAPWTTFAYWQYSNQGVGATYGCASSKVDLDVDSLAPAPSHPQPVFTASPLTIQAGQSVSLAWSHTDGASAIHLNGQGVTGPSGTSVQTPAASTTYTLRVDYPAPDPAITLTVSIVVTPPPTPAPARYTIGVHVLHDSGEPFRSRLKGTKSAFTVLDNADEAVRLARDGHDVWLRHWAVNNPYTPAQIVAMMNWVPDDIRSKIGFVCNNEDDWGFAQGATESIDSWMKRSAQAYKDIMSLAYAGGWRRFAVSCKSMGTPDITNPAIRQGLHDYFAPLYNNQTIDGTPTGQPAEVWFDWHNYVPDSSWLYARTALAAGMTASTNFLALGRPAVRWGDPTNVVVSGTDADGHVMTWMEPTVGHTVEAIVPTGGSARTIQPWEWYLTRAHFCFYEEMGVGFNPNIRRFRATETLADKGGTGGAPAQGMSVAQVNAMIQRELDIYAMGMVVNGVTYPSPIAAATIFTSSVTEWKGYSVMYVITDGGTDVSTWSRTH